MRLSHIIIKNKFYGVRLPYVWHFTHGQACNKNRFYHSKELFESCEILNVYKLNFLNTTVFMHKIKNRTAPSSFLEKSEQPSHLYSTSFSSGNYRKPQIKLRKCRFRISIRGPAIWNDIVGITEKEIQSSSHFKTKIKMQTT